MPWRCWTVQWFHGKVANVSRHFYFSGLWWSSGHGSLLQLGVFDLALRFLCSSPFLVLVTSSSVHTGCFLSLLSFSGLQISSSLIYPPPTYPCPHFLCQIPHPTVTPSYSSVICLETDSTACFLYHFLILPQKVQLFSWEKHTYRMHDIFTHTKQLP